MPAAFIPPMAAVGLPGADVSVALPLPAANLAAAVLDIAYDNAVITVADVTTQALTGCTVSSSTPAAKKLRIAVACAGSPHPPVVLNLDFTAVSAGTTSLHVNRCDLRDANMERTTCTVEDATMFVGHGPLPGGPVFVRALAVDPLEPDVLYAGTDGIGVVKSTDRGATWNVQSVGLTQMSVVSVAGDPVSAGTLYVGTDNGGVFRSTDGGSAWESRGLDNKTVGALAVDPVNPLIIYAGSIGPFGAGLYKSTDAGADWQLMNTGLDNPGVLTLALDPTVPATLYAGTEGGVFKSTDGATTWTAMNQGLPVNGVVWSLAMNGSVLYAGTSEGLFRSTDGAVSWAAATSSGLPSPQVLVVAADSSAPDMVYVGTDSGAAGSTDGGATWTALDAVSGAITRALIIDASPATTLYLGTDRQLFVVVLPAK